MTKNYPANRWISFWLLVVLGVALDLYSKAVVFQNLGYPNRQGPLLWESSTGWLTFRFVTSFNHGALWGFGQGFTLVFATLSVVAVIGVVYWLFFRNGASSLWMTVSLGFVTAGALGNLYDRLALHGYVVDGEPIYAVRDFLLFTFGTFHWPVFNFADVFLVTGSIMLILQSLFMQPADEAVAVATNTDATSLKKAT
ncbi:MAG: signal peptidase II [Planctomycetaceae bacterium]